MIIDRYLRHEISVPFLAVSAVLIAIFLTFSLTRFLIDANAGLLQSAEVIQLTFLILIRLVIKPRFFSIHYTDAPGFLL